MATSSRMLVLLSLLQARRDWPGQRLAERLEISERTVRRDIDRLRELGYRIQAIKGPDGGYRLDAGSELPPLLFDDEQAVVLAVALQTVNVAGSGMEEAAGRALTTVRQLMPSRLRHRIDAVRIATVPQLPNDNSATVDSDLLVSLSSAIHSTEVVRFDYATTEAAGAADAADTMVPPRRVEPHHVVTRAGRWYLVGWDLDRDDWRIFRVDRITPRTPFGPRFRPREVPGGDVGTFVAARFKGSSSENEWPCRGRVILATNATEVAPYVGDGVVEPLGPDRCRLTLGAWSWLGLAASVGRFDAGIEAVEPPELAEAFATLATRFVTASVAGSAGIGSP